MRPELDSEHKMLKVPQAFEIVTGIRPSPSKCWRWYTNGIKGVVLQTWLVGGSRLTSIAAVKQFIERRTNQMAAHELRTKPTNAPKVRKETREFLERELGIKFQDD